MLGLLSGIGSVLNVGGYLILAPLINLVMQAGDTIVFGPVELPVTAPVLAGVLAIVVFFIAGALHLNYVVHSMALDIQRCTVTETAIFGLKKLSVLSAGVIHLRIVKQVAGSVAFACGFVMRQLASGLAQALQLLVFLLILFWLYPLMTLVFIGLVVISGLLYARSVSNVIGVVTGTKDLSVQANVEYKDLSKVLEKKEISDAELHEQIERLFSDGAIGALLGAKLDARREKKRGPIFISYLYPLALVMVPLLALATGDLREQAGEIVVYMLLLRNVIGLLTQLASLLMSLSRFYPALRCYAELQNCTEIPECLSTNRQQGDDDDED